MKYVKNAYFLLSASSFLLQYLRFVCVWKMLLKVRIGKAGENSMLNLKLFYLTK